MPVAVLLAVSGARQSTAQEPVAPEHVTGGHAASPYVDMEQREVKALSAERRAGLEQGAGLGYAMAAELNGHAGPKHVLELADELELTAGQRSAITSSFERMHADAVDLGSRILTAEGELDRRFAHRHLDEGKLGELTAKLGELEGRLRFVHLRAHLETDAALDPVQRARYSELRGYGAESHAENATEHGGHGH